MWYSGCMIKESLRKNNLNTDLHIHALEDPNTGQDAPENIQYRHLIDIIGSAILKGLDIIGIVSRYSFHPGLLCQRIIKEKQYDLICLAGIEVESLEDVHVIIYNSSVIPKSGLPIEQICRIAHKNGGVVMAIQPSRRSVQKLNKLVGTSSAPEFIEIFNDITQGGYSKSFVDTSPDPKFELVMNSAARNSKDLDRSMMVSRIPRQFLIQKGILEADEGVDFIPPFLQKQKQIDNQIAQQQQQMQQQPIQQIQGVI